MSVSRKEKIRSSRTRTSSTLFYTKRSRVSGIRAITDTGEEKRTGEVPTLHVYLAVGRSYSIYLNVNFACP